MVRVRILTYLVIHFSPEGARKSDFDHVVIIMCESNGTSLFVVLVWMWSLNSPK